MKYDLEEEPSLLIFLILFSLSRKVSRPTALLQTGKEDLDAESLSVSSPSQPLDSLFVSVGLIKGITSPEKCFLTEHLNTLVWICQNCLGELGRFP